MSTLTVQVNTGTDASPTWTTVEADQAEIVKRRGRGGYATFRIPDADVTDRVNLTIGRVVRLKLDNGTDTVWFKGPLHEPRVISTGPGVFNLECRVGELAEVARDKLITGDLVYPEHLESLTETSYTASQDAEVKEDDASSNFGTAAFMNIGFVASATPPGDERRAYLEFDISSLDSTHSVLRAMLFLYVTSNSAGEKPVLTVHAVDAEWDESTITWSNKPDITDDVDEDTQQETKVGQIEADDTAAGHRLFLNVTDFFRGVHEGSITNNGLAIKMPDADTSIFSSQFVGIASSEATDSSQRPFVVIVHQPSVLVSDVVTDLFDTFWDDVDITGIQETTEYLQLQTVRASDDAQLDSAEGLALHTFDNLYDAMEILTNQVAGWEWWLDTSDGDDIVLYYEEVDTGAASGIGESDINYPFEIEPQNQRVINHVIVFGPDDRDGGQTNVVVGQARSSASQAIFGYHVQLFSEPGLNSRELLNDRANAILHEAKSEYWTVTVSVPGHRTLLPGRQVTLSLSNYGLDGTNFPNTYLVQETRDVFERGYWTRNLTLREYLS